MIADGFGLSEQTKAPGKIVGRLCFLARMFCLFISRCRKRYRAERCVAESPAHLVTFDRSIDLEINDTSLDVSMQNTGEGLAGDLAAIDRTAAYV